VVCLSSQYKGVSWEKKLQQWKATVYWKKHIYGAGTYINELDAAKRVNEICDSLGMERKNPEVNTIQIPKVIITLCKLNI
jgi:cell division protein FtsL